MFRITQYVVFQSSVLDPSQFFEALILNLPGYHSHIEFKINVFWHITEKAEVDNLIKQK